jgi:amino acid transporter
VTAPRRRRTVKVGAGNLGPFLCWAVVFADIGTSVYYVPGILYGRFGTRSAIFVAMTLVVFVLLTIKYAEVAWRYPEGGGVVTVASRALHPFAGLAGGLFIIVDYYLTAALSALSGFFYLWVVIPEQKSLVVPLTIGALVLLGVLNAIGITESARVSATVATVAGAAQLLVVVAVAARLGVTGIVHTLQLVASGPRLGPVTLITGYSAAFLAFSGLESIAQVAPAMREPRRRVSYRAMAAVVVTMVVTGPLLTLWSTTVLSGSDADPNQFISILAGRVSTPALAAIVAISGSLLLIFASNTALIGAYHVFIALARMGFLPRLLEQRNRWRRTPHNAILLAVVVPVVLVALTRGNVDLLGDLYAFGLLGAFVLTCLSLDIVRWHDRRRGAVAWAGYALGVATTAAVAVGWSTNLVAKPLATAFGGGVTLIGFVVGLATYFANARRQPAVFPLVHRPGQPVMHLRGAMRMTQPEVVAFLPHDPELAPPVIREAIEAAHERPVVFVYRGAPPAADEHVPALLEVADPYLRDYSAKDAFARAETLARRRRVDRRYVYVPGTVPRDVLGHVWWDLHPKETIVVQGEQDVLPPVALDRVRLRRDDGVDVLCLVTGSVPRRATA